MGKKTLALWVLVVSSLLPKYFSFSWNESSVPFCKSTVGRERHVYELCICLLSYLVFSHLRIQVFYFKSSWNRLFPVFGSYLLCFLEARCKRKSWWIHSVWSEFPLQSFSQTDIYLFILFWNSAIRIAFANKSIYVQHKACLLVLILPCVLYYWIWFDNLLFLFPFQHLESSVCLHYRQYGLLPSLVLFCMFYILNN